MGSLTGDLAGLTPPARSPQEFRTTGPGQPHPQHQAEHHGQGQQQQGEPFTAREGPAHRQRLCSGAYRGYHRTQPWRLDHQQCGVVGAAAFGIAEGEVGLLQAAKGLARLQLRQVGGVGVVTLAQTAESLAQLLARGLAPDFQQLVEVGSGHQRRTGSAGS